MARSLQTIHNSGQPYSLKISESEILHLQDLFLTPGFHELKFVNLKTARLQLYTILEALQFYHRPAALSTASASFKAPLTDLYGELLQAGCLTTTGLTSSCRVEALSNFCLQQFHYDFLWIEDPAHLATYSWYQPFCDLLADYRFDQLLPICLVQI